MKRMLALVLVLVACGGDSLRTQARSLEVSARLFNAGMPLWIRAYEQEGRSSIDAACGARGPAECPRSVGEQALAIHSRRWSVVAVAWESTRVTHDAWRAEVQRCRRLAANDATCNFSVPQLAGRFLATAMQWRCAVRAVGRADLDPLGEHLLQCSGDAGAP